MKPVRLLLVGALLTSSLPAAAEHAELTGAALEARTRERLIAEPRVGIYIPIPQAYAPTPGTTRPIYAPGGPPVPVFINRNGGTYYRGQDNSGANISSIVPGQSAVVDGFGGSDATWDAMMDCIREQFSRFNVEVTDVEPSRAHVECVVGGSPDQLGLPQGVGGVAPIDPYGCDVIDSAIVYVFSDVIGNSAQVLCEVAAQEIAHSFSLDHELLCQDPMTYLNGCGAKSFQNVDAQCGEYQSRECICNRDRQNSVQIMLEKLGPSTGGSSGGPTDAVPPTVQVQSPTTGSTLPADRVIEVVVTASDDVAVADIELIWPYTGNIFGCPMQSQNINCALDGDTATWLLRVGTGTRQFQARARDTAGNEAVSAQVDITLGDGTPVPDDNNPPVVSVVSPNDGAVLPANSTIEVVASATDDVGLENVELVWPHTNEAFGCPSQRQGVTCTQNGSTFTWSLPVGTGERPFQIRAVDQGGNLSITPQRMVYLDDGTGPPPDNLSPQVIILRPADGSTLPAGEPVEVAVTVTDNVGVADVELRWDDGAAAFACPTNSGATCSSVGSSYVWTLGDVPNGVHGFTVRATDAAGNEKITTRYTVELTDGAVGFDDDNSEENDTFAEARPVTCGTSLSLISLPGDPDWFTIDVPPGTQLLVDADSRENANLDLRVATGPDTADLIALASGPALDERVLLQAPVATLAVLVQQTGGGRGAYALSFTCDDVGPGGNTGEDDDEPNNSPDQARVMFCGQTDELTLRDVDHFKIQVREGDTLSAHAVASVPVTVEVLGVDGQPLPGASATGGDVVAGATGLPAGAHVVRISPVDGATGSYALTIECLAGDDEPEATSVLSCAAAGAAPPWLMLLSVLVLCRRRAGGAASRCE